jgi:hypothetical protein
MPDREPRTPSSTRTCGRTFIVSPIRGDAKANRRRPPLGSRGRTALAPLRHHGSPRRVPVLGSGGSGGPRQRALLRLGPTAGKVATTSVRCLISPLSRCRRLVECSWHQGSSGKAMWESTSSSASSMSARRGASQRLEPRPEPPSSSGHDGRSYTTAGDMIRKNARGAGRTREWGRRKNDMPPLTTEGPDKPGSPSE